MDIYSHLMKPVNNEEAVKLRATLFSRKNEDNGSRRGFAMKKAPIKPCKCLILLARLKGVEPLTYGLEGVPSKKSNYLETHCFS